MITTYDDIQKLLFSKEFIYLVPDGITLSEPIPGTCKNGSVDNYFVMKKIEGINTPVYKFGICFETKNIEYFSRYENVNIPSSQKCTGLAYDEYQNYIELYGTVRAMFTKNIPVQTDAIKQYAFYLSQLTDSHLYAFYSDLSPEFFVFLNNALK